MKPAPLKQPNVRLRPNYIVELDTDDREQIEKFKIKIKIGEKEYSVKDLSMNELAELQYTLAKIGCSYTVIGVVKE